MTSEANSSRESLQPVRVAREARVDLLRVAREQHDQGALVAASRRVSAAHAATSSARADRDGRAGAARSCAVATASGHAARSHALRADYPMAFRFATRDVTCGGARCVGRSAARSCLVVAGLASAGARRSGEPRARRRRHRGRPRPSASQRRSQRAHSASSSAFPSSTCAPGDRLLAHNPTLPLDPASNQKLITAAAGLIELGADFRMLTGAVRAARGRRGRLAACT